MSNPDQVEPRSIVVPLFPVEGRGRSQPPASPTRFRFDVSVTLLATILALEFSGIAAAAAATCIMVTAAIVFPERARLRRELPSTAEGRVLPLTPGARLRRSRSSTLARLRERRPGGAC